MQTMDGEVKGRGALSNPAGRFARSACEPDAATREADALAAEAADAAALPPLVTTRHVDAARSIITRSASPDLPFSQSINAYRGCEHGCIYCYARATHAYLDLSPGRDFETELFYKPNAPELLRKELAAPRYNASPIALGTNTDPYQPLERDLRITRAILELLLEVQHPVTIVTKGTLILRDLDLLAELATRNLVSVNVSITTLDNDLKRRMEPRTAGPQQRLNMIEALAGRGVPTGVLAAPMIPGLNDYELEHILEEAAARGARSAGYVLLRLPHEVADLFAEWLLHHYPDRAQHVLSLVRQMRGGELDDPQFHSRQRGHGPFAAILAARFRKARRDCGLDGETALDTSRFVPPRVATPQLDLWDR
jgi:DNA repair photolyase